MQNRQASATLFARDSFANPMPPRTLESTNTLLPPPPARNVSCSLLPEEAIGAYFGHLGQNWFFFAAIFDPGIEGFKRRRLDKRVVPVGGLDGYDVDERHSVAEPEGRVSQSRRTVPVKFLKHFLNQLLILVGLAGFDLVPND